MNRRRLLFIGILALTLGGFLSFKVYRLLQANIMPATVGVDVLEAANNIVVGAKLEDHDLKVVKLPSEGVPPDAFHTKARAVGRGVVLPIGRGDFVLPYKLAPENAGAGPATLIPLGMRAAAVRVNDVTSVAGFVVPGTRVDVLVTGNPPGSSEPQTRIVLQNVAVLASGQRTERSARGEPLNTSVVTLLVFPEDAEKLALASHQGIQLVLRNPLDTHQENPPAMTNTIMFGGKCNAGAGAGQSKASKTNASTRAPESPELEIEILRGPQKEIIHLKP